MGKGELPIPPHFSPERIAEVRRVPYEELALQAERWAAEHGIAAAAEDRVRICLVAVDVQNTFCTPGFELFVAGRSGTGAVDDSRRLCEFVYRNLAQITEIVPTLDTHQAIHIFHSVFLVDAEGRHPDPYTLITAADVERGAWRINPDVCSSLGQREDDLARHLLHYARTLEAGGRYNLTIWPYHAMLGGIGHALVSAVEEAVFFHAIARRAQPDFQLKGRAELTEHYSMLGPEVEYAADGRVLAERNRPLIRKLAGFDAVVVAGQAKSHCVAWTIDDLLEELGALAHKVYLLEDCTSPVVVPGVVDYTDEADAAFRRFAEAGVHVVRSTEPIAAWPGIAASLS